MSVTGNRGTEYETSKTYTYRRMGQRAGSKRDPVTNCIGGIALVSAVALLVIAFVGSTGYVSSVVMGSCSIALSVPVLVYCVLVALDPKNKDPEAKAKERVAAIIGMIITAAIAALGVCAIARIMPPAAVGLAIAVPTVIGLALAYVGACCALGKTSFA